MSRAQVCFMEGTHSPIPQIIENVHKSRAILTTNGVYSSLRAKAAPTAAKADLFQNWTLSSAIERNEGRIQAPHNTDALCQYEAVWGKPVTTYPRLREPIARECPEQANL